MLTTENSVDLDVDPIVALAIIEFHFQPEAKEDGPHKAFVRYEGGLLEFERPTMRQLLDRLTYIPSDRKIIDVRIEKGWL